MSDPQISLDEQVACVARELSLRRSAYPKFVARHTMEQEMADKEIARMTAVLETLKALRDAAQAREG